MLWVMLQLSHNGLLLAKDVGFSTLIAEIDCQPLFFRLQRQEANDSMFGLLIEDIHHLAQSFASLSF